MECGDRKRAGNKAAATDESEATAFTLLPLFCCDDFSPGLWRMVLVLVLVPAELVWWCAAVVE